jgi:hypothetical protein
MAGVFLARLICSDSDCTEEFEAYGSLDELTALACDCGCSLELIAVSEAGVPSLARGFALARSE